MYKNYKKYFIYVFLFLSKNDFKSTTPSNFHYYIYKSRK